MFLLLLDRDRIVFNCQSSGNSSRMLEIKVLLSLSQRLKNRPAKPIKDVGTSGIIISTFSSATYRMLVSSTLEVLLVSSHLTQSMMYLQGMVEALVATLR